ncbi:hypothetical protein N9308_01865 [Candidatus Pelagibacter sp.]|jgi:hypothetical protein|nr:hypothetical protein [Candidatus Pelagibacter sp.]|tara:strand:+ start:180 stop:425 length:246 start_codon:yes stop_codon:yes gene_type:complete
MRPVFKIIIVYEILFFLFWNFLYYSNSGIENWFETEIITAVYTFLSTMALGFGFIYVVYTTARLTGMISKIKAIKDPRKNI